MPEMDNKGPMTLEEMFEVRDHIEDTLENLGYGIVGTGGGFGALDILVETPEGRTPKLIQFDIFPDRTVEISISDPLDDEGEG